MSNSLLRGLEVLGCFSRERRSLNGSELSKLLGIPQPTVWRICKVLESQDYLVQEPDGRYRPGLAVLNLGYSALDTMNIAELARPQLQVLADEVTGTAGLSTPERFSMLFLQRCEARAAVLNYNMAGSVMVPIGNSASGWAYLSVLDEETREAALQSLTEEDPAHAAVAKKHLAATLRLYEKEGFVLNAGVFHAGLTSVAVPFRSQRRGSIYVVSCSAMSAELPTLTTQRRIARKLQELARQLQSV